MRKPRQLQSGGCYHVSARANRQEMIMYSSEMKQLFLLVVALARKKYAFRIWNFTVMGNHFHFMIQPLGNANLSAIMQWILSVFAMRWNRIHNLKGHVWGERFFSRLISGLQDFLQVFRYIDQNPVKSGLVANPGDWPHGGNWHFRRGWRHIVQGLPDWARLVIPLDGTLLLC